MTLWPSAADHRVCRQALQACLVLLASCCPAARAGDEPSSPAAPSDSREMLALFGIDDAIWSRWNSDPIAAAEDPQTAMEMLYAVRRFRLADLEGWTQPDTAAQQFAADPLAHQGEVVLLRGTLEAVETISPPAELAERFELSTYYVCRVRLAEAAGSAIVLALDVPQAWLAAESSAGERVSFRGVFLGSGANDDGDRQLYFAAQRVAWHPQTVLGDLGMDVGLFDAVENRSALGRAERECYYQLLAACGRAGAEELLRRTAGPSADVVPLFNSPESQKGRLVALEGVCRRAAPILVDEPELQSRFGLERYYELEIFTDDSQSNPLVCVVRDLPEGFPTGDRLNERVRVPAFFMKTWAYHTPGAGEGKLQLAPLLIGRTATWLQPPKRDRTALLGLVAGLLFVAAILVIWLALWRVGKRDRRFEREVLARKYDAGGAVDLNQLVVDDDASPASHDA